MTKIHWPCIEATNDALGILCKWVSRTDEILKENQVMEDVFRCSLVAMISDSHSEGPGSIPGSGIYAPRGWLCR